MPDGERGAKRVAHWRQIATAAAEQSGRNRIPEIAAPRSLADWLSSWRGTGIVFLPDADCSIAALAPPAPPLAVMIGPEGGFDARESAAAKRTGISCAAPRAAGAARRHGGRGGARRPAIGMGRLAMIRCAAALVLGATLAGCVMPARAPEPAAAKTYAFVVLGEEGGAVARAITTAPACPAIEFDGVAAPMEVRARPATIPLRPTRSEPALSKPSAFPVLVCEKAVPAGVTARDDSRSRASVAQGPSTADRRHRRHRLPDQDGGRRVPGVQRSGPSGRSPPLPQPLPPPRRISSFTSATITIAKTNARPATRNARAAHGAMAGMRGRPISSHRRSCSCGRRRGSSFAATTNRAIARGRAGGVSSIRVRSRRGRIATPLPTTRSATTASRTPCRSVRDPAPTLSSSCSILRSWVSRRCPPTTRCTSAIARSSSGRSRWPRGGRTRSS